MREQRAIDATTFKRRASLPPEERAASHHYAGTRAGTRPEDDPYITYGKPPGRTYVTTRSGLPTGYDDEGYDDTERRSPTTALRWRDTQGNQVIQHGNRRIVIHDVPPPRRKPRLHWSLFLGTGMIAIVLFFAGLSDLSAWWANHQLDATYGMPRTYQTDAIVYPGDSAGHPSHYIFLNLNGTVMIIELPHGGETHARIYKGPTLFSDDAASIPVTGDFRKVNGKEEMRVHIQDQVIVYINDGTQFKPQ